MATLEQRIAGLRKERTHASMQWSDNTFKNPTGFGPKLDGALPVLGEFVFRRGDRTPSGPLPLERPQETWATHVQTGMRVTWRLFPHHGQ